MTDDYAPFPEAELRDMVLYAMPDNRATLKSALLSFAALRERCLLAETENAQLKRKLLALTPGIVEVPMYPDALAIQEKT